MSQCAPSYPVLATGNNPWHWLIVVPAVICGYKATVANTDLVFRDPESHDLQLAFYLCYHVELLNCNKKVGIFAMTFVNKLMRWFQFICQKKKSLFSYLVSIVRNNHKIINSCQMLICKPICVFRRKSWKPGCHHSSYLGVPMCHMLIFSICYREQSTTLAYCGSCCNMWVLGDSGKTEISVWRA